MPTVPLDLSTIVRWGERGPTVVFLHYYSGAASSWTAVAEKLKNRFQCVALNLPGFGACPSLEKPSLEAYATWVAEQIEASGITEYILVGHSMGAKIAMQLAATQSADSPSKISDLLLVAPSPATIEPMSEADKHRLLDVHPSRKQAETTVSSGSVLPIPPELRHLAIITHMIAEPSAWRWWPEEGMKHSIAGLVKNISIPVTVLASHDDPVIDHAQVQTDVIDLIPNAKLISVSGVGHLIPLEKPKLIADSISSMID